MGGLIQLPDSRSFCPRLASCGKGSGVLFLSFLLLCETIPLLLAQSTGWSGWTDSRLIGSPTPPLPYTVEEAFPHIEWRSPIYVIEEPGSEHLWVIQQKGEPSGPLIVRLENHDAARETKPIYSAPDWMLYALTFDPDFAENQFVYLFQNGPTGHDPRGNRISRFRFQSSPEPTLDPDSELIILEWRSAGHDGGDLAFGPDGMLYLTTGDGTSDSDTWNSGQTLDDLLGAVLRIDVSETTQAQPYQTPPDNPFLNTIGARPEIWAYGLRNPWRMGIDPVSGQVWVGNNGQDLWETAHLIGPGENYGWSVYEGSHPFYSNRKLGPTPHVKPTLEQPHSAFRSLTGGIVYRGEKWTDLSAAYLYGDYSTGRIWGARHDGNQLLWHRELADTTLAIAAFRGLRNGDLIIVDHAGHKLYRLARNNAPDRSGNWPRRLSETGLFESPLDAPLKGRPGVIPYQINAHGWNDGASASHWMALPPQSEIQYASQSPWGFPNQTALVQTLTLPDSTGQPRPIETRILLRQQNEWNGYSYYWREDGSDADLVSSEGFTTTITNAAASPRQWTVPSRAECAVCHSRAANYILGITGQQLNRPVQSGDQNQLRRLEKLGLFRDPVPSPLPAPIANPYDRTHSSLTDRARAYLHVNCSGCHVEAGGGNAQIVLHQSRTLEDMRLVNHRPQHATFGLTNAMLISPGRPDQSVLLHRVGHRGTRSGQMPPLGTHLIDENAVKLLRTWIASMPKPPSSDQPWTLDEFAFRPEELGSGRNYLRGRRLFTTTGCIQCHRFESQGGTVGPDLRGLAKRRNPQSILQSLLDPSADIAPEYIIPDSSPPMSTMPTGMLDALERDEILDLLYYLIRDGRPRVAAIVTEYRHNSHADIIVSRLLQTDTLDGKGNDSPLELVSLYTDQQPENDTSRMLSASHRFPIFSTIREALTLGGKKLAVDGVLMIAEHGDYPLSETGNRIYPKRRFWNEIYAVFEKNHRGVPVFVDKHLADNWTDAAYLYQSATQLDIPLMAGSSLPTTWRHPPSDVSRGEPIKELVAITYHTTDAYGFHALEFIQALLEQRQGGESGVTRVESVAGVEVWQAIDSGLVPSDLFQAAWDRLRNAHHSDRPDRNRVADPRLFTISYHDGTKAQLLELNGAASEWTAAWRGPQADQAIESTLFWTQEGRPGMHFTWLLNGIEAMIRTGQASWNVERTLLTSGILDALLLSLKTGQPVETPYLNIRYQPTWRWKEPPPPPPMRPWADQ